MKGTLEICMFYGKESMLSMKRKDIEDYYVTNELEEMTVKIVNAIHDVFQKDVTMEKLRKEFIERRSFIFKVNYMNTPLIMTKVDNVYILNIDKVIEKTSITIQRTIESLMKGEKPDIGVTSEVTSAQDIDSDFKKWLNGEKDV